MGVPKFYRWISERYPCLSEVVREHQIPDFDNLYLDMNGIIHGCSHPNDDDPHFRITEEKIFADICHYIECLFKMIRPKKVFFMAVDGVAPRAKMNQQRGRRFRSAREAEECEKRAVSKGEVLPTEERFDSNCITPGTEFMVKLQEHLKYFVTNKISTDKTWQGIRVYLSGHETPGEGEHKIMEFIRSEKSKPDYNAHTRHCLYGLDADLIMLGLCSHEPHFSLLREEVNFARKKNVQRIQTPEEITFHLLHLSLLREYIDYEFSSLKDKLPFPYDIENIIDDWVLMGFLVGNDFIPHLPHMHIAHDALPSLYQVYIEVLPTLDGYINEGGYLNLLRFEKYLQSVSRNDYDQFEETYANIKWLQSKTGKSRIDHSNSSSAKRQKTLMEDSKAENVQCDQSVSLSVDENGSRNGTDLIGWEENFCEDSSSDPDEDAPLEDRDLVEQEFTQHKRDYYIKKLSYERVTPEVLREQAECYVSAIQWILHYYYNGVCSWSWYYPHHYAPYVSDVKDFHDMKLEFEIGTPFLPFEQLLAVLPAASKKFLPEPYRSLMCDANSPLIDYYPTEFETDLNGKQHSWEAIVLIPFIDEKRLLDAMKPIFEMVSKPEQDRNVHKPCLLYTYCAENLGKFSASALGNFPDVEINHAKCEQLSLDSFYVERSQLRKGLCEDFKRDLYIPGFPTLKHIPHKVCLKKAGVKVFQMPSRNNSMILEVEQPQTAFTDEDVSTIARELIGNTVYVGWPHIAEARVVGIFTPKMRFRRSESSANGQSDVVSETHSEDDMRGWHCYNNVITDKYKDRFGVFIGKTEILVQAQIQMGKKYVHVQGDHIALEKQWSATPNMYAYQTVIKALDVFNTRQDPPKTLEDLYPAKSLCFLLSSQYYGRCAEVISCDSTGPRASIQLAVDLSEDPNLTPAITDHYEITSRYATTYFAAQRLGVSGHLLSRMMGTFQVSRSGAKSDRKVNIGLNLKFNTRSKEVVGFSRRIGKDWTFSDEAIEAMEQYLNKFPEMFENISRQLSNRPSIPEEDIFPGDEDAAKLDEVLEFLKTLPCYTGQQQACGSEILEADIIKAVEDEVDKVKGDARKIAKLNFSPRHIFSPSDCRGISLPDSTVTFELFDRVINIKEGSTVPLGHKGTVTGIYPAEKIEDMTYDVVFDHDFPGGLAIRCSPNRGYRVSPYSVINITHGLRKENSDSGAGGQKPTAIVRPQTSQHHPAGVSSVYGKTVRVSANNKGPKFQYGRGRACPSGPSQAPAIVPRIGTSGASTIINPLALHTAICPAPPNLAQDYHFRKFNHSPNSPFVPRQACPPAATGPQPQFITPKVFTNTQFQMQYRQPPPLISVRQGAQSQESEFANLWMQLQMANTNTGTVRNRDDVKPPDKPLNVLINSDKSRPRNSPRVAAMLGMNPTVPCNPAPCPGGSRQSSEFEKVLHALQNITVQQPMNKGQVENAAVLHQHIAPASTASKPASVQEINSISSSSSSAITKLLRPNELAKEGKDMKKEENVSMKVQQSYGRSISVEELFRDAKETERQRQVQAQAQMQVALGPTTPLDNSSCVSVLEHFVYSYSRELPNYDCIMVGPSKMYTGRVMLPDKRVYTGRQEASKKAAEESAALVALNALGQQAPKLFPSNLRGLGPYSDNVLAGAVIPPGPPAYQRIPSASVGFQGIRFPSSVGSRAHMRSNMPQHPFPHRQPGPAMHQVPMQYSNANANPQGPYGNRNQGFHKPYQQDASRLGYGDQSGPRGRHQYQNQSFGSPNVSPQKPNAFVPLQVSRQQKSSSGKKATLYQEPTCETRNDGHQHEAAVHAATANVQKETTNVPGNIHGNVLSGEAKGKANRRSSRLAVNFSKVE